MSKKKLSREEIAKIEIGQTTMTKAQSVILCVMFLGLIAIYPIFQLVYELRTRNIEKIADLQPLTIFPLLAEAQISKDAGVLPSLLNFNRGLSSAIKKYEDSLEDTSALRAALLGPSQQFLLRQLGTGNEKAILGKDDWLFYVSGFNYLINPGFLLPEQLHKRSLSSIQPDPVKAIVDFNQQLKERGIRLILLPAPVKPMLYGDKLGTTMQIRQNPSYQEFKSRIEAEGISIMDFTDALFQMRQTTTEPYLHTDTHWSPKGAWLAARLTAEQLASDAHNNLGGVTWKTITGLGDIANMLHLSDPTKTIMPESVEAPMIPERLARYSKNAEILLLGDSFVNIYDLGRMGWSDGGGFAKMLSFFLKKPVDVIARNDSGAYATRQLLANELKRGRDRLAGKKIVIWEFVIRELAVGDWKMLDMTLGKAPEIKFINPQKPIMVTATVLAVSEVPRPYAAPYKDHIMSVHLGDINGGNDQAIAYMVSMRDNVRTPAAQLRIGETAQIELASWADYEATYGSWNRSEINNDELLLQEPCWGKVKEINHQ